MADQNKQGGANQGDKKKDPRKDINEKGGERTQDSENDMSDLTDMDE